jgi:hypothetical protein
LDQRIRFLVTNDRRRSDGPRRGCCLTAARRRNWTVCWHFAKLNRRGETAVSKAVG